MSTLSPIARQELAALLRGRREALRPAQVGLPERVGPSRTPGLRREEVATLAGVSVDYLTRLEQARDVRPSVQVTEALAAALRLDDDQRTYLFTLAGHRVPAATTRPSVPEGLARLVTDLDPLPAMIVNHRLDILAWNGIMSALLLDLDEQSDGRLNVLRRCFLDDRFRDFYQDRDEVVRGAVLDLRAAWADHADDRELARLIDELESGSVEFAGYWRSREVSVRARGDKPMLHPVVGPVTVSFDVLNPLDDPDLRLIVYRAADDRSQTALDELSRTRPRHLRAL
ncbi:helix-turn-helix transcriptional regulator [Gordonia soli]|uniref:Putative DNA-binding protein n=1 Tax=Gordonia soli NBRC 108243 TaxID=1223545 RepID=M0QEJ0_9ACTN|nr:helix-turn-helix transcriptional regulator [Gordonia soli]GAC67000.1 putative DNA-binding protein [Gordonia soli NBRC 108243]